jgi:hypothetical protein
MRRRVEDSFGADAAADPATEAAIATSGRAIWRIRQEQLGLEDPGPAGHA